jgi:hypothetical protein
VVDGTFTLTAIALFVKVGVSIPLRERRWQLAALCTARLSPDFHHDHTHLPLGDT